MVRFVTAAVVCLLSSALSASETGWILARNSHFEVYCHSGSGDAREVLRWFEGLHSFFEEQSKINVDSRLPLRVVVFSSVQEYIPYRPNPTADAYYTFGSGGDFIVLPFDADRFAAHEYWHFVAQAGGMRLPLWLNEGLAEFYSTVHLDARGGRMGATPARHLGSLRHEGWINLPVLLAATADSRLLHERETSGMFYAESWALTHLLKVSPAYAPRFPELLEHLAAGMPSARALEATYGRPVSAIASDLRDWYAKGRTAALPAAEPLDASSIEVSHVSPEAMATVLASLRSAVESAQL